MHWAHFRYVDLYIYIYKQSFTSHSGNTWNTCLYKSFTVCSSIVPIQHNFFFLWLKWVNARKHGSLRRINRGAVFLSRTLHTSITNFRHPVSSFFRLCHSHATIIQCHIRASLNSYSVSSMFLLLLSIFLCVACALGIELSILSSRRQHPWRCILSFILSLGTAFCPSLCHCCLWHYILSFILSLMS